MPHNSVTPKFRDSGIRYLLHTAIARGRKRVLRATPMLNPSRTTTERLMALLLIPLLLSMGIMGRTCLCHHEGAEGMAGCSMEAAGDDCHEAAGEEDGCDPDEDCCCFDSAQLDASRLAEVTSTITQSDPLLQCAIALASPSVVVLVDRNAAVSQRMSERARGVPWPEERPLFALFESYLC